MTVIGTSGGSAERPAIFFDGPEQFRAWLEANHDTAAELWMGLRKKHVPDRGLTWELAVPEALCFGWIDSTVQRIDADAVRQRWTPRKPASTWSNVNIALVQRLTEEGRMRPAGLAAFERRSAGRTGVYAYERDVRELPESYAQLLAASAPAAAFWAATTASYRRIAINWVLSAKQSTTRDRRIVQLVEDSASGLVIAPQRYGKQPAWVARAAAAARDAADE